MDDASPEFVGPPEPLLSRIRRGDSSVIPDLLPELSVHARHLCAALPNGSDRAAELINGTWARHLARKASFFRTRDGSTDLGSADDTTVRRVFTAYLKTIAENLFRNDQARARRDGSRQGLRIEEIEVASGAATPEEEAERAEQFARVSRAVECLPPAQREVILLKYTEDRTEEEIAAALGISEYRVKYQARVARAAIRKRLGEEA